MLSLMLQRTALRAPVVLSRVGLSTLTRAIPASVVPKAACTFATTPASREPSRRKEKDGEDGEGISAPKRAKKAASTESKKSTAGKAGKDKKKVKAKKAVIKPKKVDISGHEPPKRPLSAWMLYVQERKTELNKKYESVSDANQFMKEASETWRALSDSEKQKYGDAAAAAYAEYRTRREQYLKTVPSPILKEINARLAKRGKNTIKVPSNRPATSFLNFAQDYKTEFDKAWTGPSTEYVVSLGRAAGERWRNLSSSEKEPYVNAYKRALEDFHAQKKAAVDAS